MALSGFGTLASSKAGTLKSTEAQREIREDKTCQLAEHVKSVLQTDPLNSATALCTGSGFSTSTFGMFTKTRGEWVQYLRRDKGRGQRKKSNKACPMDRGLDNNSGPAQLLGSILSTPSSISLGWWISRTAFPTSFVVRSGHRWL